MSTLMGDHQDYYTGMEWVIGNTLSGVTTVNSAVFDPGAQRFWMASRQESPVGLSDYIEVNVERFWKQSPEEYDHSMSVLPHYQVKNPQLIEGIRHYREAYRSYHTLNHEDHYQENALRHLVQAASAFPSDGHIWIQAGILALTLKKTEEALNYFEASLKCEMTLHVRSVRDLYLARCYDLIGVREKAIPIYTSALTQSHALEPKLKKHFSGA